MHHSDHKKRIIALESIMRVREDSECVTNVEIISDPDEWELEKKLLGYPADFKCTMLIEEIPDE